MELQLDESKDQNVGTIINLFRRTQSTRTTSYKSGRKIISARSSLLPLTKITQLLRPDPCYLHRHVLLPGSL